MDVRLVMFRENGERRDFPLTSESTTIGRKDDCDIRIPLSDVSRKHAEIIVGESSVSVKDMGSVNGTYVNNRRVKKERLAPGDRLVVGPVVFIVQIDGDPVDIRPVKTKLHHRQPAGRSAVGLAMGGSGTGAAIEDGEVDPISALEALASSADQTAIDPFPDEDGEA